MGSITGESEVIAVFFQSLANAFLAGDHVWLSGIYIYPLVVYSEGEIFLERQPEKTLANLLERRDMTLRAGTKSIRSKLVNVGASDSGRFPVRVNWEFLDAHGDLIGSNELRYFCRFDSSGDIRIEILEFLKRAFPTVPDKTESFLH